LTGLNPSPLVLCFARVMAASSRTDDGADGFPSKKARTELSTDGGADGTIRLTYFAGWGLAEQTRWVLAATGVEFEQVALTSHDQFSALRESGDLLFRQLPLLEIDGLKLTQSQAMLRYVARRGGLDHTGDPAEGALVDMVCEAVKDARSVVTGYPFSEDKHAHVSSIGDKIAKFMPAFEASIVSLESSAGEDGLVGFVRSGLSTADVVLAEFVEEVLVLKPDALDGYAKIAQLHAQVVAMPSVQAYLKSDKRYPFPLEGKECDNYVKNVRAVLGRT